MYLPRSEKLWNELTIQKSVNLSPFLIIVNHMKNCTDEAIPYYTLSVSLFKQVTEMDGSTMERRNGFINKITGMI